MRRFRFLSLRGLMADDPAAAGGAGGSVVDPAKAADTAAKPLTQADIDAAVQKATQAQAAQFGEQFKAATGFDSLDRFQEDRAKKTGETDKLLEQRTAELNQARAEVAFANINAAILAASGGAVDPDVVRALLAGKAQYKDGAVTIDGKSPVEAVKALLEAKPYLAKAGPAGGGTPAAGGGGGKSLTRAAFEALGPADRMKYIQGGGRVTE